VPSPREPATPTIKSQDSIREAPADPSLGQLDIQPNPPLVHGSLRNGSTESVVERTHQVEQLGKEPAKAGRVDLPPPPRGLGAFDATSVHPPDVEEVLSQLQARDASRMRELTRHYQARHAIEICLSITEGPTTFSEDIVRRHLRPMSAGL
jgi:hypothetical protein